MTTQRLMPLLAPLLYLYLLAEVVAASAGFDRLAQVLAFAGFLLVVLPLTMLSADVDRGGRRVTLLVLSAAFSMLSVVAPSSRSIFSELGWAWAGPVFVALSLDLCRDVPASATGAMSPRVRPVAAILGVGLVVLGSMLVWPVESVLGLQFLLSPDLRRVCALILALMLFASVVERSKKRLFDSSPESRAANVWALFGLVPATVAMLVHALSKDLVVSRVAWATCVCAVSFGHVWLLDERRRVAADRVSREVAAVLLALVVVAIIDLSVVPSVLRHLGASNHALVLVAACALSSLLTLVLALAFRPRVRWLLAPAHGALLDAVQLASSRVVRAVYAADVAKEVLAPLDGVASHADSRSALFMFNPDRVFETDLAGAVHARERSFSPTIAAQLAREPHAMICTDVIASRLVRNPEDRPLFDVLSALDAFVVLPLRFEGELEGVLIVARGARKEKLSLEEATALGALSEVLGARLALLSANERARLRAQEAEQKLAAVSVPVP